MRAALEGARAAVSYQEGDTIAILPGADPSAANEAADIVLATGLDIARNLVVANSDAVVAIGGGAGTLSEIALAWQLRRPVVALDVDGWSGRLGGLRIDERVRQPELGDEDVVHRAESAEAAVAFVDALLPRHPRRHRVV